MVPNSEELMTDDDMEWILVVIDNDILAEPNNLETDFAAIVSKIQNINSESCFNAKTAEKHIKQKGIKSSAVS